MQTLLRRGVIKCEISLVETSRSHHELRITFRATVLLKSSIEEGRGKNF